MNNLNETAFSFAERVKYADSIEYMRDEILTHAEDSEALELLTEDFEALELLTEELRESIRLMRAALDSLKEINDRLFLLPEYEDFKVKDYLVLFDAINEINEITSATYD